MGGFLCQLLPIKVLLDPPLDGMLRKMAKRFSGDLAVCGRNSIVSISYRSTIKNNINDCLPFVVGR
jgi:hypothetical protein